MNAKKQENEQVLTRQQKLEKENYILKIILVLLVALLIIVPVGIYVSVKSSIPKEQIHAQNKPTTSIVKDEGKIQYLKIGQSATIDNVTFTLKKAAFTSERNEEADENPKQVIKLSYTILNNQERDYIYGGDAQLYVDCKKAQDYPLNNTNAGTISRGRSVDIVKYVGVNGKKLELEWKPMFSNHKPVIYKIYQ